MFISEINQDYNVTKIHQPIVTSPLSRDEIYNQIIEMGYDPTYITNAKDNIFHQAAKKGDLEVIQLAIAYGLSPTVPNKAGNTALHIAAEKGNYAMCQYLLQVGCDVNQPNYLDQCPYHLALKTADMNILKLMEENGYVRQDSVKEYLIASGYSPNFYSNIDDTLVHKAVKDNNKEILSLLLNNGYPVDAQNKAGRTPLMIAAEKGYENLILLLIEKAANVNATDLKGNTALILACKNMNPNTVKLLLEQQDISIDKQNDWGLAPIHYACANGDSYSVKYLLEKGADCNKNTQPPSILVWGTFMGGHRKQYNMCLSQPANPLRIVLHIYPNNDHLIKLLEKHGAIASSPLSDWDVVCDNPTYKQTVVDYIRHH